MRTSALAVREPGERERSALQAPAEDDLGHARLAQLTRVVASEAETVPQLPPGPARLTTRDDPGPAVEPRDLPHRPHGRVGDHCAEGPMEVQHRMRGLLLLGRGID